MVGYCVLCLCQTGRSDDQSHSACMCTGLHHWKAYHTVTLYSPARTTLILSTFELLPDPKSENGSGSVQSAQCSSRVQGRSRCAVRSVHASLSLRPCHSATVTGTLRKKIRISLKLTSQHITPHHNTQPLTLNCLEAQPPLPSRKLLSVTDASCLSSLRLAFPFHSILSDLRSSSSCPQSSHVPRS